MANLYGLTGGGSQNANVYPVQPATPTATVIDFESLTVAWDEAGADGDMVQIQYSVAELCEGTVTTEEGTALVGDGTNFTDFNVGDYILVNGSTEVGRIAVITDAEDITLAAAFGSVEEAAAMIVSTTWTDLVTLAMGVETYDHTGLTAETGYFYRIRTHKRTKWSDWGLLSATVTPAE